MTRRLLQVTGSDREKFLQGLVTNDVRRAAIDKDGIIHAALLTPQGKYLADFFVIGRENDLLIDASAEQAPALAKRLSMYRLRADVQITESDLIVSRGTGEAPEGALQDPRHPALGWRFYGESDLSDASDWDALRVAHLIPESGIELTPDSYILENGFDRLHGVDFRKGCYVGQEVTARMKHKTELRKGLMQVHITGAAPAGTPITMEDGREAGVLYTISGDRAIAWLRFDRATGPLKAAEATITALPEA